MNGWLFTIERLFLTASLPKKATVQAFTAGGAEECR